MAPWETHDSGSAEQMSTVSGTIMVFLGSSLELYEKVLVFTDSVIVEINEPGDFHGHL
jgi:hypothetical protein